MEVLEVHTYLEEVHLQVGAKSLACAPLAWTVALNEIGSKIQN
jgi:hypothetical protein